MAKFQIFQYLFRPVMENQAGLPAEVFRQSMFKIHLPESRNCLVMYLII